MIPAVLSTGATRAAARCGSLRRCTVASYHVSSSVESAGPFEVSASASFRALNSMIGHNSGSRPAALKLAANSSPMNGGYHMNAQVRTFALMPEDELKKRMDDFQDLFVEARLCIEDAQESAETTYFAEDLDAAQESVNEAVAAFEKIVADIDDKDQKNSVLRSNGLKVEQLKGEIQMIVDGHGHHH